MGILEKMAMSNKEAEDAEQRTAHHVLVRLANSCERAAARGEKVLPMAADLNADDYREIADILRKLADTIDPERA